MSDTRSLFFQELAVRYPLLWRYGQRIRTAFMLSYLRTNIQRGISEGFYHAGLRADEQARQWFQQLDASLRAVPTAAEGVETHYRQVSDFLGSLTTPLGAYVVRRLQEAPPYY